MLKTIRTNFDRHEMRRDRRYALPPLAVSINGTEFTARNWSLGGFQLSQGPSVALGAHIGGTIRVAGDGKPYNFTAEAVRRGNGAHGMSFRFRGLSPDLITALDRAVMRRFAGRRH